MVFGLLHVPHLHVAPLFLKTVLLIQLLHFYEQMVQFWLDTDAVSEVALNIPHIVLCDLCWEIVSKGLLSLAELFCMSEQFRLRGLMKQRGISSNHKQIVSRWVGPRRVYEVRLIRCMSPSVGTAVEHQASFCCSAESSEKIIAQTQ